MSEAQEYTIYVCGNCRSNEIQESNENDSLCADCGEWMNVEEVRVAPVGGTGVRLTREEAEKLLDYIGEEDDRKRPSVMSLQPIIDKLVAASVGEGVEDG